MHMENIKSGKHYAVFNTTDGFFASPDQMTKEEAEKFVAEFAARYDRQGYYRTGKGEKINPKDVVLTIKNMLE